MPSLWPEISGSSSCPACARVCLCQQSRRGGPVTADRGETIRIHSWHLTVTRRNSCHSSCNVGFNGLSSQKFEAAIATCEHVQLAHAAPIADSLTIRWSQLRMSSSHGFPRPCQGAQGGARVAMRSWSMLLWMWPSAGIASLLTF